jgi:threonine dehydrogenase-like Zn-dependent dehydrogenase
VVRRITDGGMCDVVVDMVTTASLPFAAAISIAHSFDFDFRARFGFAFCVKCMCFDPEMLAVAHFKVGHQGASLDICSDMCARDGTVLIFGLPPNSTDADRGDSHGDMVIRYSNLTKNITYLTSHVGGDVDPMPLFEQSVEMLAAGRMPDLSPVITVSEVAARGRSRSSRRRRK